VAKSSFDSLLETLSDTEEFEFKGPVRKAFAELAEKVPKLKDSVLAQSDYSRKMDEVRDKVKLADTWNEWRKENWDDESNASKSELRLKAEADRLAQELETARTAALGTGEEMTFEQLNQSLDKYTKDKGIVDRTSLDEVVKGKATEFQDYVKGYSQPIARAAVEVPGILLKHQQEFGEIMDTDAFMKYAAEKGRMDYRDLYEKDWVVERRTQKMKADYEKQLADAKTLAETDKAAAVANAQAEAKKQQVMGSPSGNPIDNGSSELGPLQRRMQVQQEQLVDGEKPKAPEVPIGEGGLAAFAAREFLAKQAGRTN